MIDNALEIKATQSLILSLESSPDNYRKAYQPTLESLCNIGFEFFTDLPFVMQSTILKKLKIFNQPTATTHWLVTKRVNVPEGGQGCF